MLNATLDFFAARPELAPFIAAVVALIAAIVALTGTLITRSYTTRLKISEFRQAWINELRQDIADFIGASHRFVAKTNEIRKAVRGNFGLANDADTHHTLVAHFNEVLIILWRIRLRFSPEDSKGKADDDALLETLQKLTEPDKLTAERWFELANSAVEQSRKILKREWEVTKQFRV